MTFAQTLAGHCALTGTTQPELARLLGVCPRTAFAWIKGDVVPSDLKQDAIKLRLAGARRRKKARKK